MNDEREGPAPSDSAEQSWPLPFHITERGIVFPDGTFDLDMGPKSEVWRDKAVEVAKHAYGPIIPPPPDPRSLCHCPACEQQRQKELKDETNDND